jgi:hypothetical protein
MGGENKNEKKGGEIGRLKGRVGKGSGSLNISPPVFCYFPTLHLV